jgi:molybdopterin-dependent oxidoreductase alpha subunit
MQKRLPIETPESGGGWFAIKYSWKMAKRVGLIALIKAMRSKNACKTCALGMGGQKGGMRNEQGRWPEFCKKSLQAMVGDMQGELKNDFFKTYSIYQMESLSSRELETAGRLVSPMYQAEGASHFEAITWKKAFSLISEKLKSISPSESFWYFSGRSSNEAGFLLQLLARQYGTNNINNCSYYCHQASGVGMSGSIGAGTATIQASDIEKTKLFFIIGANPASNHPRLLTHLLHMKRNGGRVIVINPVKETGLVNFKIPSDMRSLFFGSQIADEYIQVNVGGDIALLTGIAKRVFENKAENSDYISKYTNEFTEFKNLVKNTSWNDVVKTSGISQEVIEGLGDQYSNAESAVFSWAMGITHHLHGVENVQWIANLAMLRGMIGRKNSGLLPLRGHSNVQGMGTVGVTPALKKPVAERFKLYDLNYPAEKGLDTMGCMDAANNGKLKFGISLGGNLFGSNPDSNYAKEALSNLDLMVYVNTSMNTGHLHGRGKETLILPVLARDEEPYKSTQESMFSYVRLSDGGPKRYNGPRPEVDIIADIADMTLESSKSLDWSAFKKTDNIRALIAKLVPGLEQMKEITKGDGEFHIPGRAISEERFPTPNGKANFISHKIPESPIVSNRLKMISIRSEGQFNTVVYEEEDLYRGQERRDIVLVNKKDLVRFGLKRNDVVSVKSKTGIMKSLLVRDFDIKEGAALMYYPECNVLVSRDVDKASLTPAFKNVDIELVKECDGTEDLNEIGSRNNSVAGGIISTMRRVIRPKMNQC